MLTVDRVLHAVRRYDTLVVGLGVAGLDLTLQHHSDGIFCQGIIFSVSFDIEDLLGLTDHMMNVALPNDSSDPDEIFAVSSGTEVSGL